ncbi:MAG: hypothetical protein R3185_08060, partial [Candidatus Thermoplasmatota archaeon]|nr:hypothetical protein [Candidatus Thermoplasmatota archaeon]
GHRLLAFRREEYRSEEGYLRRAFYWHVRWENIRTDPASTAQAERASSSVYDELPQDAWARV